MQNATRELQVWNQLLVICLNTPPRPAWGHSMHFCDQAPRPPFLIKSLNKNANRLGLSWRFHKYVYYLLEVAQKNSGAPPKISEPPQMTTHQPTPLNRLIYIPIDSFWRQDTKHVIYITINTRRQNVMILTGSCTNVTFMYRIQGCSVRFFGSARVR